MVDVETLSSMLYRLKKLQSHHRSFNLVSRERATKYLRLRVVREFGFPDYVAEVQLINYMSFDNDNNSNNKTRLNSSRC